MLMYDLSPTSPFNRVPRMKLFRVGTGSGAFLRTKLIGEMQNDAKSKLSDLSKRAIKSTAT